MKKILSAALLSCVMMVSGATLAGDLPYDQVSNGFTGPSSTKINDNFTHVHDEIQALGGSDVGARVTTLEATTVTAAEVDTSVTDAVAAFQASFDAKFDTVNANLAQDQADIKSLSILDLQRYRSVVTSGEDSYGYAQSCDRSFELWLPNIDSDDFESTLNGGVDGTNFLSLPISVTDSSTQQISFQADGSVKIDLNKNQTLVPLTSSAPTEVNSIATYCVDYSPYLHVFSNEGLDSTGHIIIRPVDHLIVTLISGTQIKIESYTGYSVPGDSVIDKTSLVKTLILDVDVVCLEPEALGLCQ